MTEDHVEFVGYLVLLGIVAFSLTTSFWNVIVWLGH